MGTTHDDYKSVFYTLYKLAMQGREKFDVMSLMETREIGWTELRNCRQKVVNDYVKVETIDKWNFNQINMVKYYLLVYSIF